MAKYVECEAGYDYATLEDWYINSVSETDSPVWTKEHLEELLNDFYLIPKDTDTIEVVRCKDCKFHREAHYEDEGEPPYIKHVCKLYKRTMQLDDYCSYGERKV